MSKRRALLVLGAVLLTFTVAILARAAWKRWPDDRVQLVAARPELFHSAYYVFVPDSVRAATGPVRLLVFPNNTSVGAHDDPEVHRADAYRTIRWHRHASEELGVIALVPVFPRPRTEWKVYTHALDRDVMMTSNPQYRRLDLQLIAMIDDARERFRREGITVEERVLLQGFSAGGMFVSRFTLLHPERVRAAVIGAPGGWPMVPTPSIGGVALRYPMGTADFEAVTGAPFRDDVARQVPMLFHLGADDTNDSVPFEDGYDPEDTAVLMSLGKDPVARWDDAERAFVAAGFTNARFELHEGVGHDTNGVIEAEIRALFER